MSHTLFLTLCVYVKHTQMSLSHIQMMSYVQCLTSCIYAPLHATPFKRPSSCVCFLPMDVCVCVCVCVCMYMFTYAYTVWSVAVRGVDVSHGRTPFYKTKLPGSKRGARRCQKNAKKINSKHTANSTQQCCEKCRILTPCASCSSEAQCGEVCCSVSSFSFYGPCRPGLHRVANKSRRVVVRRPFLHARTENSKFIPLSIARLP